jgi:hypothetical protein
MMLQVFFVMGEFTLVVIAVAISSWRGQFAAGAILCTASLGLWFVVPESGRWLQVQGRGEEAYQVRSTHFCKWTFFQHTAVLYASASHKQRAVCCTSSCACFNQQYNAVPAVAVAAAERIPRTQPHQCIAARHVWQ